MEQHHVWFVLQRLGGFELSRLLPLSELAYLFLLIPLLQNEACVYRLPLFAARVRRNVQS